MQRRDFVFRATTIAGAGLIASLQPGALERAHNLGSRGVMVDGSGIPGWAHNFIRTMYDIHAPILDAARLDIKLGVYHPDSADGLYLVKWARRKQWYAPDENDVLVQYSIRFTGLIPKKFLVEEPSGIDTEQEIVLGEQMRRPYVTFVEVDGDGETEIDAWTYVYSTYGAVLKSQHENAFLWHLANGEAILTMVSSGTPYTRWEPTNV